MYLCATENLWARVDALLWREIPVFDVQQYAAPRRNSYLPSFALPFGLYQFLMDTTAYLFDLLKIILPALIVAGSIFYLIQQYLEKEQQRRVIELRLEATKTTLPLRLQALERVTLLLERITPNNILIRLGSAGQTAPDYYRLLLQEIRAEYEHNLSQQLYMSPDTWAEVKGAKEHVLTVINKSYQGLAQPQQARGTELAKRVLETLINEEVDPTERALNAVKREAAGLF